MVSWDDILNFFEQINKLTKDKEGRIEGVNGASSLKETNKVKKYRKVCETDWRKLFATFVRF